MALALWNTLTRGKQPFEPLEPPRVRLFVCGPTVYDRSHLGHAKTYTQFDLIARYLRYRGYDVEYVQNITDIDDKIIARANERGISSEELAQEFEAKFLADMETLGNTSVTRYARASEFIPQIVSQVERLLEGGHAYELPDGFYFDIESFPDYGKLARRTDLAREDAVSRVDENPLKRNPGDFALWKRRKPGEPYWITPIGEGRPGWHIEDTAITESLLGPQYDIHGGAVDLIFPHHEAEIAQMESISGRAPLAKYWLHTGFLNLREEKMSKSLGNFFTIAETIKTVEPRVLRFFLLSHHYRSPIDFDPTQFDAAAAALRRIDNFYLRAPGDADAGLGPEASAVRDAFIEALDDDFDTPRALAVLFEFIRDQHRGAEPAPGSRRLLDELDQVLGVLPALEAAEEGSDDWIAYEVERREHLRRERRFAEADEIRDQLHRMDVMLEDTPNGVRWYRASV
ncbi:MAG TPA: cysteine--tRNA ligase [Solirubrobacteraceae bacterium]